ncbi:monalysin family beta-barrel pore-forming toxin [Pseudomonas putida]|uniref:monalysin family beta-barrel pore-forming toxin n=1 Tax=Pseudomonas putida TaxID=303 RepID=UPI00236582C9|nr:monalysin family beta-barrel pore-forming toxin [Pseudomonas putida]MDD2050115.1 monalysin family beta-barrel pore-forming toxin [Pseudomonas putida]
MANDQVDYDSMPVHPVGRAPSLHLATGDLNAGCWLEGKTVRSPIHCAGQRWDAFSVPVFAYLVAHPMIGLESAEEQTIKTKITQGFSHTFTQHIEAGLSISAQGMGAEMNVSFEQSDTWSSSTEQEVETKLKGGSNYFPYQIHVVFAHCLRDGSEADEFFSPYRKVVPVLNEDGQVQREDLYFLSSVATQTVQYAPAGTEVEILDWEEIQQNVLMNHFDPESNSGKWSFDFYG